MRGAAGTPVVDDVRVTVHELAALVEPGDVVVLTGAGISTESGIPDYRGATGAAQRENRELVRALPRRSWLPASAFAGSENQKPISR